MLYRTGLEVYHRQCLFARRRPGAAEPEKKSAGAHRVVNKIKPFLNRRNLARQNMERDARSRVREGGKQMAVIEVDHERTPFFLFKIDDFDRKLYFNSNGVTNSNEINCVKICFSEFIMILFDFDGG